MSRSAIRVGQRVRLPWGLDTVDGTVVEIFGPPARPFVRVEIEARDLDDDEDRPVIAVPADSVEVTHAA